MERFYFRLVVKGNGKLFGILRMAVVQGNFNKFSMSSHAVQMGGRTAWKHLI